MLRRAALALGAATLLAAASASAQSARPESGLAGRWALTLEGGAPPRVRGELRLYDSAGTVSGTILLATQDSAPVPLRDVQLDGRRIEFIASLGPGMRFVGLVGSGEIAGEAFGGSGGQLQTWRAARISGAIEFYPSLPRFTLRQIIAGPPNPAVRVPGSWLAAAEQAGHIADSLEPAYRRASAAAGLVPLASAALAADGGPYLLGVYHREQTGPVLVTALERIDRDLPAGTHRIEFRRLFASPDGRWLPDVHAVALDRARRRSRTLDWPDARGALTAAGWIPGDTAGDAGTLPYALYRLAHLETVDSAEFRRVGERMASTPQSARAVRLLLDGYREALEWYPQALGFLLTTPWVATGTGEPRSIAELMDDLWSGGPQAPALRAAFFGYPQAVPRYGTPDFLVDQLIVPENWTAGEWIQRNGRDRLLTVVQRLGVDSLVPTTLERDGRVLRLSTVRRQAGQSINGFLEAEDAIVADPGVAPLLALGTIVHEWQHLAFERARWQAAPDARPAALDTATGIVTLRAPEPVIAEGLAEWSTGIIMAPVVAQYPIVGLAEPLKRARLARMAPSDPHITGYLLARVLAEVVTPDAALDLLVEASTNPQRVVADARVAKAWRAHAGAEDDVIPRPAGLVLVPETRFTIEGGWPDPIESRIRF